VFLALMGLAMLTMRTVAVGPGTLPILTALNSLWLGLSLSAVGLLGEHVDAGGHVYFAVVAVWFTTSWVCIDLIKSVALSPSGTSFAA
jgi:hypothetical protein